MSIFCLKIENGKYYLSIQQHSIGRLVVMIEFTAGTAIGGSVGIVNRIEYIAANA